MKTPKGIAVTSKRLESALDRLNNLDDTLDVDNYRIVREIGQGKYTLIAPQDADLDRAEYLNAQQAYYFLCGAFNALAAAYRAEKSDHVGDKEAL